MVAASVVVVVFEASLCNSKQFIASTHTNYETLYLCRSAPICASEVDCGLRGAEGLDLTAPDDREVLALLEAGLPLLLESV